MTAEAVLDDLLASGITPTVTPDGTGIVVPAGRLTAAQRAAILAHKSELIARIQESARMTADLLAAAMRVCDAWGDTPAAREQMRRDCLSTPPHLRADLLDYLNSRSSATAARALRGRHN